MLGTKRHLNSEINKKIDQRIMASYRSIRRQIVGYSSDWIIRFDVRDYISNPPLIEKLHEEKQLALASTIEMEHEIENLKERIHKLELYNTKLSTLLSNASHRGIISVCLSILSVLLMGIGVNIVTDKPYVWAGWTMIVASIILQITILFSRPKGK